MEQSDWLVKVVLRATEAEVEGVVERLGKVICVPEDHDSPCLTPWNLVRTPVDDLDEPERSGLRALLDEG